MFKLFVLVLCFVCLSQAANYNVFDDEDWNNDFRSGLERRFRETTVAFLKENNLAHSPDRVRDQSVNLITKSVPQLSATQRDQVNLLNKIIPFVWW